jgi:hypothetical protein
VAVAAAAGNSSGGGRLQVATLTCHIDDGEGNCVRGRRSVEIYLHGRLFLYSVAGFS